MEGIYDKKSYRKNEVIIQEGTTGTVMYSIISGKVGVIKKVDGKKIILATLEEEDFFGEMALINKRLRCSEVVALEDVTVGLIDWTTFDKCFVELPRDFRHIIETLAKRLEETNKKLVFLAAKLDKAKR